MKNGIIFCLFICISSLGLHAQPQTALNANNTSAGVSASGTLFSGGLEIPKNSNKKSIALTQFWIGGKNNGNVHIAAQLNNSQNDFWAGPLDTLNNQAADSMAWNVIHKITKQEIDLHKTRYNKQGYIMPNGIEFWPGSSPTNKGFAKILAPFVDFNNNKIYEPEQGEYPFIRGDETAYFIANDNANSHFSSGGLPMGVEVHGMVYQYANQPDVENTVFLQLSFINRSTNDYDSVYAGIWSDFLLGNENDNYISTNTSKNAYLVYNGDTMDDGPNGYGLNPPAQAVVFLSHSLDQTIEIAMDNSPRGIPKSPQEFYNYLKHTWRDGEPLTEGSNGYKSLLPTKHIYSGEPCNLNGWTELGSAFPVGKRTMLGSIGPVSLKSKDYLRMDIAFVWSKGSTNNLGSVCQLNDDIDKVNSFYRKQILSTTKPVKSTQFEVYPNPASNSIILELSNYSNEKGNVEIFDVQGRKVIESVFTSSITELNVSSLAAGLYTVKVNTKESFGVKKLLITR